MEENYCLIFNKTFYRCPYPNQLLNSGNTCLTHKRNYWKPAKRRIFLNEFNDWSDSSVIESGLEQPRRGSWGKINWFSRVNQNFMHGESLFLILANSLLLPTQKVVQTQDPQFHWMVWSGLEWPNMRLSQSIQGISPLRS